MVNGMATMLLCEMLDSLDLLPERIVRIFVDQANTHRFVGGRTIWVDMFSTTRLHVHNKKYRERKPHANPLPESEIDFTEFALAIAEEKKTDVGYIYFFRSVAKVKGKWVYKYGRTTNWERRRKEHSGPSTPGRVFCVRRVKDPVEAEAHLGRFLRRQGFVDADFGNEWLVMPN
jgi:hypothetical protein